MMKSLEEIKEELLQSVTKYHVSYFMENPTHVGTIFDTVTVSTATEDDIKRLKKGVIECCCILYEMITESLYTESNTFLQGVLPDIIEKIIVIKDIETGGETSLLGMVEVDTIYPILVEYTREGIIEKILAELD